MAYRGQLDEEDRNDYLATFRRVDPAQPERKLLRAVLEDGIQMLLKDGNAADRRSLTTRRDWHETLAWIMSEAVSVNLWKSD